MPGTLKIVSSPPGARVYLDNESRGTTPLALTDIPPGNHSLELRLEGFEVWVASGTMDDGGAVEVEATLIPVSPAGPGIPPVPMDASPAASPAG